MVRDHPLFGVGPEMIDRSYYAATGRISGGGEPDEPASAQRADADRRRARHCPRCCSGCGSSSSPRGISGDRLRARIAPAVAGAGLAAMVAMLAAGLFEYNFGDSEFLMLFLGLITLPFAAARDRATHRAGAIR